MCQRYFEIVAIYDYPETGTYYAGWKFIPPINFIVPKRTTPTVTTTTQSGWPNGPGGTYELAVRPYSVQAIGQSGNALNNNMHQYTWLVSAEL